jgi:raffinose/stachyose/melibiose transport system substrate-binding protein
MKKSIFVLFLVTLMVLVTACGTTAQPSAPASQEASAATPAAATPAAATPAPVEKVKLRLVSISTDDNQNAILNDFIKKNIETALPNIEVEYEPGGGGEDMANKMKTYNSTGDLPDVWYSTSDYAYPIIAAGNQLELTSYITDDGFLSKYAVPDALKNGQGKIYCISSGADTYFTPRIYYNKKIFEDNKVQIPTNWDELVAACNKFKDAGVIPISLMGKGGWAPQLYLVQTFIQLIDPTVAQQLLTNQTDFNNPVCLEAAQKIAELAKMGAFPDGVADLDYGPSLEMFTSGKSAMFWGFTWEVPNLAKDPNIGLMLWPKLSDKVDPATVTQFWGSPTNGYAVNAKSEHVAEAEQLAEFCVAMEAQFYRSKGSNTNLDPGTQVQGTSDLMTQNLQMYNNATSKIATIYLNAMDSKTAAEYGVCGDNLLTGSYTGEQFIADFQKAWAANEFFK